MECGNVGRFIVLFAVLLYLQCCIGQKFEGKFVAGDGSTCILIELVNVTTEYPLKNIKSTLPSDATITAPEGISSCPDTNVTIEISWMDEELEWLIGFEFIRDDDTYYMYRFNVETMEGGETVWRRSLHQYNFQTAHVGSYMECQDYIVAGTMLTSYKIQPFAAEANGDYGEMDFCTFGIGGGAKFVVFLVTAIACAILLIVFVGVKAS